MTSRHPQLLPLVDGTHLTPFSSPGDCRWSHASCVPAAALGVGHMGPPDRWAVPVWDTYVPASETIGPSFPHGCHKMSRG